MEEKIKINLDYGYIPKVFISYSHDSKEHMDRVLVLSDRLRAEGIDCIIDQYETSPPDGWARWMVNRIKATDFVLVVCSETYERRFEGKEEAGQGKGGNWEGAIITHELYNAESRNNKFIPVFFSLGDASHIPIVLHGATHYLLNTDEGYEALYRHLTDQHATPKPELGKIVKLPTRERVQAFPEINQNIQINKNFSEKSNKINIIYHPDIAPEPTSDFINREIEQTNVFNSLNKKRIVVIQGMAGIGKTELAAKVRANLRDKYITYWKTIESQDNFDSIIRNLAGFFNENNNKILFQYLEQNGNDFNTIITNILTVLNSNHYILFFDNYHNVTDEEIHKLFSKLKENLKNSTIILTTRMTPDFMDPEDDIQNKILDTKLEGFDLKTTQEYFFRKGISLSQEQLNKINEKMGGHPLALLLFFSYINENKDININDALEEIPKEKIEKFLWKKVFPQLSLEEREILDFLSVFRKEIKSDTLSNIIKKDKVIKNLSKLENKLLVKRKRNLYYLHDLLKEFCYDLIELPNRKKIHQNIADYYKLQERTQENLVEASHHLIKNYEIINEEIIDYFLSMPNDAYSFFIINERLKNNRIQTLKIFNLFYKFIALNDIQIITAFILSYGYYFEDIYAMDNKISFEIYHKILQSYNDSGVLDAVSQSVKELAEKHPDESLSIWKKVIEINPLLTDAVVTYLNDINLRNDKIINFLEDILNKTTNEFSKLY